MEVTVPHGLFIQSCYWSNEFLFGEAGPPCLRVSLVEQAVISFGFPSSFGAEPAIRGGMQLPERARAGTGWRLAQMFSELCPQWHKWSWLHEILFATDEDRAHIQHAGSKGKSGFTGSTFSFNPGKRERRYFLCIQVKGGMRPFLG